MRHLPRRAAALLLAAAALACAGSRPERDGLARDLLTDLADDGSLVDAALSPDVELRELAVRALANLPPAGNTDLLLNRVEIERDPAVLEGFCFLFGRWQHEPAIPLLEALTADARPRVRAAAFDALGRFVDDALTTRLLVGLDDSAGAVRAAAADALARVDAASSDHPRSADADLLLARDTALAAAALHDPDPLVRWHAVWALGRVRARPGHATVFRQALPDREPLVRLFALRGLARDVDADVPLVVAGLDDPDPRVALEAAAALARLAPEAALDRRLGHPDAHVRRLAAAGLRAPRASATGGSGGATSDRAAPLPARAQQALERLAREDASPMVVREARATLAVRGDARSAEAARAALRDADDPRDRQLLAQLLADGDLRDVRLLDALLVDPSPTVRAAAVAGLAHVDPVRHRAELVAALASDDVAVRGSAAEACAPLVRAGTAPPWMVSALADSLDAELDPEMEEARVSLAAALRLPPLDPVPPAERPEGELVARLQAERAAALADRFVQVELVTDRGTLLLELDRSLAPRHVASLLELAEAGFYDGLDVHRAVPNFVVQGLDPRGDGWGTGGRRLPDEFTPTPVDAGTVGMPRTGARHTGGCQLFITAIPTPHLRGDYTVLGRVVDGMDVVTALQIGDRVREVRRLPAR